MSDYKHINEFRKGTVLRKINEDPTYLSFFLMFDTVDRQHSPLLSGAAEDYLNLFIDGKNPEKMSEPGVNGTEYGKSLENFKNVLLKINMQMPWFWQKISGLELTQTYGKMDEPWRGSEKPKIDIECLEENIELTAIGLMTLYKKACYDYQRYLEVLPKNLRHFRVWVIMSEVRTFQQSKIDRNLNLYGSIAPENASSKGVSLIPKSKNSQSGIATRSPEFDTALAGQFSADAKPYLMFELGFCEWQQDSIADMFADASKIPELKKPKISFTWQTAILSDQKFGENISTGDSNLVPTKKPEDGLYPHTPFNPLAIAQNAIADKVNGIADALVGRFNNLKNSLPGFGRNPLGRVYPEGLTGPAATIANAGLDKVKSLILDNVHGAEGLGSTIGDINAALESGSINGILNMAGQFSKTKDTEPVGGSIDPLNVHDGLTIVDSSPDGNIGERVYSPGVDSSQDNLLNDNVYE